MKHKTLVNKALDRKSTISSLNPFLDKDGIACVSGVLENSFKKKMPTPNIFTKGWKSYKSHYPTSS